MSAADPIAASAARDAAAPVEPAPPPPADAPLPSPTSPAAPPVAATPPSTANALAALHDFAPVPVSARTDGWTAEKQRAFIEALADAGSVPAAARAVGMSVEGAYRLRRRADAAAFAEAWDVANGVMVKRLTDSAFARAIHGVRNPIFYQGEIVGERVHYDERLTRFLLEKHDPLVHGHLSTLTNLKVAFDPLTQRIAGLPRLLARLFRMKDDPKPAADRPARRSR